jgi:two-component system NtrC family sensor kinase
MTENLRTSRAELEKALESLQATQSQLVQSEKLSAVGQFVAGVAHELNNPLSSVIGFADLLAHNVKDTTIRNQLELIGRSAHRCHKIVTNLLSFARQHPPERRLTDLNTTLEEVLEIMAYDLRTSNITVLRELQADLPLIMADPHQLQQVFVNIMNNARQALQAFRTDGRIVVRTKTAGRSIRVEFSDNGPGIRPEHLSRIFDPFFTTKPVGKGTGLGMSLSYGIVHEHGGEIAVRSELGQGALFTIDLPVTVEGPVLWRTEEPRPAETRSPFGAGRAVLVVDDEPELLQLCTALLQSAGFAVETAGGGERAIDAISRRKFDVIVCDWKMPGLNGIQLHEHLCAANVLAASRMIFMTGDVISDTFQEFLSRTGRTCLSKPFAIG